MSYDLATTPTQYSNSKKILKSGLISCKHILFGTFLIVKSVQFFACKIFTKTYNTHASLCCEPFGIHTKPILNIYVLIKTVLFVMFSFLICLIIDLK